MKRPGRKGFVPIPPVTGIRPLDTDSHARQFVTASIGGLLRNARTDYSASLRPRDVATFRFAGKRKKKNRAESLVIQSRSFSLFLFLLFARRQLKAPKSKTHFDVWRNLRNHGYTSDNNRQCASASAMRRRTEAFMEHCVWD